MKYICLVCGGEGNAWPKRVKSGRSKYCSLACKHKGQSIKTKGKNLYWLDSKGSNNPNYKGDNVGYSGIHRWIRLQKGTPKLCEKCGSTSGSFHWHNISHEYKRDELDWVRLCTHCHMHTHKNWQKSSAYKGPISV